MKALDEAENGLYHLICMHGVVGNYGKPQGAELPFVLIVNLCHGDVELAAAASENAFHHLPLGLEGAGLMNVQRDIAYADDHFE
jgi:hypothetical protein